MTFKYIHKTGLSNEIVNLAYLLLKLCNSALDEPSTLKLLSKRISDLLPVVDLTELLLEINAHTGFSDEFTHASEAGARMDDLTVSICAVLLAEACNIGIDPFISPKIPALIRYRLSWTRQNYLRQKRWSK